MQKAAVLRPESAQHFSTLGDPIHLCIYSPGPGINCDQQSFKELKNDLKNDLKTVLASKLEFNCFLLQGNTNFQGIIGFRFQILW